MRCPILVVLLAIVAAIVLPGCRSDGVERVTSPSAAFEVRAGSIGAVDGWERTDLVVGGTRVWMSPDAAVDASMVRSAVRTSDVEGRPAVMIELDEPGAAALTRLSTAQLSRPVVVVVDGRPTSAPIVMSPLGARFMITADDLTDETCNDLVRRLSEG